MDDELRSRLRISQERLDEINALLLDPNNRAINDFLAVVARYGTPDEINRKAEEARALPNLRWRMKEIDSPYLADLDWLAEQRVRGAFISMADYRRKVLAGRPPAPPRQEPPPVTLEISSLSFFPWLITEAKQAIANGELMPGRYIRVRNMKEQTADQGDTLAMAAAMQIVGASYVETLDTKGTDGSNCHLGGPATITGYFGGIGQPNDHALKWLDEFLHYYTTYGIRQVLNINSGTILLAYFLHKLGVDVEFKISVFVGNDNPYAALWTLMAARLFARPDGSTSLIGFNWSNAVQNETIEIGSEIRRALGLENVVRFEHHVTETYKSIVRQPYDRTAELVALADHVPNIAAKHEGAGPSVDAMREHPSDILDYFLPKADILAQGLMPALERNYLDKHEALNRTACALVQAGIPVVAAWNLHR